MQQGGPQQPRDRVPNPNAELNSAWQKTSSTIAELHRAISQLAITKDEAKFRYIASLVEPRLRIVQQQSQRAAALSVQVNAQLEQRREFELAAQLQQQGGTSQHAQHGVGASRSQHPHGSSSQLQQPRLTAHKQSGARLQPRAVTWQQQQPQQQQQQQQPAVVSRPIQAYRAVPAGPAQQQGGPVAVGVPAHALAAVGVPAETPAAGERRLAPPVTHQQPQAGAVQPRQQAPAHGQGLLGLEHLQLREVQQRAVDLQRQQRQQAGGHAPLLLEVRVRQELSRCSNVQERDAALARLGLTRFQAAELLGWKATPPKPKQQQQQQQQMQGRAQQHTQTQQTQTQLSPQPPEARRQQQLQLQARQHEAQRQQQLLQQWVQYTPGQELPGQQWHQPQQQPQPQPQQPQQHQPQQQQHHHHHKKPLQHPQQQQQQQQPTRQQPPQQEQPIRQQQPIQYQQVAADVIDLTAELGSSKPAIAFAGASRLGSVQAAGVELQELQQRALMPPPPPQQRLPTVPALVPQQQQQQRVPASAAPLSMHKRDAAAVGQLAPAPVPKRPAHAPVGLGGRHPLLAPRPGSVASPLLPGSSAHVAATVVGIAVSPAGQQAQQRQAALPTYPQMQQAQQQREAGMPGPAQQPVGEQQAQVPTAQQRHAQEQTVLPQPEVAPGDAIAGAEGMPAFATAAGLGAQASPDARRNGFGSSGGNTSGQPPGAPPAAAAAATDARTAATGAGGAAPVSAATLAAAADGSAGSGVVPTAGKAGSDAAPTSHKAALAAAAAALAAAVRGVPMTNGSALPAFLDEASTEIISID